MCCQITTPAVDQYKPKQHQTFALEKFRDLIIDCTQIALVA